MRVGNWKGCPGTIHGASQFCSPLSLKPLALVSILLTSEFRIMQYYFSYVALLVFYPTSLLRKGYCLMSNIATKDGAIAEV